MGPQTSFFNCQNEREMSPTNKINQLLLLASKAVVLIHDAFLAFLLAQALHLRLKYRNEGTGSIYHIRVQPFKESALPVGFAQCIKKYSKS